MTKTAKFNIGDFVKHQRQGYRAVVVDVDPIFQASGRPNPQACSHDFTQRHPWYRLLVDNSQLITYVEECHLLRDDSQEGIHNPNMDYYLVKRQGHYHTISSVH